MQRKFDRAKMFGIVCGMVACLGGSVRAGIVKVGGAAVIAEPPPNISHNLWESDTGARVWFERTVELGSPLAVNAVNTGMVFPVGTPGDIAPQAIESYMLRTDPIGGNLISLDGFVVFDQPILGVVTQGNTLDNTDALLGRPGINYNLNEARGLENPDTFLISADRLRVDFLYETGTWTDDVRIITAVPEPGSIAMLALAGLTLLRRRSPMLRS